MTQEEKAKAYDKALEKARQLCAYPTTKPFINDLQDLFPELAESEDEKTRKRIIALVNAHGQGMYKDEMLAWLEKQGEQKTDKGMIEALRTEYEKGRHDVIEKTLKWLWDLNQEHEIMSYTDSHVLSSGELQKYYKNNIEE